MNEALRSAAKIGSPGEPLQPPGSGRSDRAGRDDAEPPAMPLDLGRLAGFQDAIEHAIDVLPELRRREPRGICHRSSSGDNVSAGPYVFQRVSYV